MRSKERAQAILLAAVIGFAALYVLLDLLLAVAPVSAREQVQVVAKTTNLAPSARPVPEFTYTIVLTDPSFILIYDLSGDPVGEGVHLGKVKCKGDNCSQTTSLDLEGTVYEYRFTTRLAQDPEARRVVVEGTGTLTSGRQKERFSFSATFEDNRDGTVSSTYSASRPDASFSILATSGMFEVTRKR